MPSADLADPGDYAGVRFHDPLDYWARRFPALLYADGMRVITYVEAVALTQAWMRQFRDVGVGPCDRVALVSDNDPLAPLVICATSRMGAVTVPLNPRLSGPELADLIATSGAKAVVAGPRHAELLDSVGVAASTPARLTWADPAAGWGALETTDTGSLEGRAEAGPAHHVVVQPFTSGTTGTPKSALVRHESFVAESFRWQAAGMRLGVGERFYHSLPLTLAAGMCMAFHTIWNGATLVTEPFDAATAARRLVNGDVEAMVLVPTMIHMVLEELGHNEKASPNLRWLFYGAAPMSPTLLAQAMERLGCEFFQGYGATEAMGLTLLTPEDHERAAAGADHLLRSVGRAQFGCAVRVITPSGDDAAPGEVGEICSIGPQVFAGYTKDELNARAFDRNGWYYTGDLGYLDAEGYLYITDRKDNMIISGGINVSPAEVEAVILEIDAIEAVAVVGLPHPRWGQQVVAVIQPRPGFAPNADEVMAACEAGLAPFKRPKSVEFVAELPHNANGKLQHGRVRAQLVEARRARGEMVQE
jgi:acyl-CoA synthetase (AMP-forming)/AMP-acid ligase II